MKKILKSVVAIFFLAISIFLFIVVKEIDVLPTKYFLLFVGVILFINLIGAITLLNKKKWTKVFSFFSYGILLIGTLVGISYGLSTLDFLNKSFNNNKIEVSTYDVLVLKSSNIKDIKELKSKTIGYLEGDSNKDKVVENINDAVDAELLSYDDLYELYDVLIDKIVASIVINAAYLDELVDETEEVEENVAVIYSFDIEEEIEEPEEKEVELKPMNIYLSGSDSRSKTIQNKSRSDVNMVLTINPNTKTVLMTSIPRDYYVQVHGQTGLKDKLTHAGIYGIDRSRETVEDLFDIEIAYSIKVGMNAVEEIVDLVGGVDINSDKTFNSYHIKGWTVKKGINHMNGKEALAYSRERYAYASGDRHRILNQQQVLEAVLKKVLSDKAILTKYDKLLASLSNLYRTDIPKILITDLVKMQIDDMSGWTFISNSVSGSDASSATYTAPNSKRYVMVPYEKDVKDAHDKIISVLNGTN
ncbi:MAG: LCP family protein [Erysipelotrichales bacterium]|nr:LCP family protein [Erysipelotrichales bacterium]